MERIILGSADVYIQAFDGSTVPVTADICKPENLMAYISGGASVEYKPSFYTAKDDTGKKSKTIVTEEEVTLKTGIMTFDGNKFKYLCDTARVTEDKAKKRRTVKIGGIDNRQGARYVICLHHKDAVDGDIWVTVTLEAEGPVINPAVYHAESGEFIKIGNEVRSFSINAGDVVIITTETNNKAVYLARDGVKQEINEYLDEDSDFIQLQHGTNTIRYTADAGEDYLNVTVSYRFRYLGV